MLALGARMRSRCRFASGKHLIYHTVSLLAQRGRGHFYERQEEECVVIHFEENCLAAQLVCLG